MVHACPSQSKSRSQSASQSKSATEPKSTPQSKSPPKSKSATKSTAKPAPAPEQAAIMQWTARMGAVTAESAGRSRECDRRLRTRPTAGHRAGRLDIAQRPLAKQPALYTLTRAGMRSCGLRGLDPCRVSASNAQHLIVCAQVAAALERCYPDHRVLGERELRRDERERGVQLASARMGIGPDGGPLLHRPDLVLWPQATADPIEDGLPVAVEVELTIKAPQRLADICLAWARCRCVAGVLYIAPPEVRRALQRALDRAQAHDRIVVVGLDALPSPTKRERHGGSIGLIAARLI